jgi:hypothetical protein
MTYESSLAEILRLLPTKHRERMKLMIQWEIHPDRRHEVFAGFAAMDLAAYQAQQGANIKVIGRWHDVINGRGVGICETDDAEALSQWLLKWNDAVDFEISVVLDDEEAHALAKANFPG